VGLAALSTFFFPRLGLNVLETEQVRIRRLSLEDAEFILEL